MEGGPHFKGRVVFQGNDDPEIQEPFEHIDARPLAPWHRVRDSHGNRLQYTHKELASYRMRVQRQKAHVEMEIDTQDGGN